MTITESLQVIVAHLKNIQVSAMIDQEQMKLNQLESLAKAEVADELKDKLANYEIALATKKSLNDVARARIQGFVEDNQELQRRLQESIKGEKEKEQRAIRLQKSLRFCQSTKNSVKRDT